MRNGMQVRSGHIIFDEKVQFKDLAPVYSELFLKFLRESDQVPEEEEYMNMLLKENLMYLEKNRKPEGYNRMGRMRLIFPLTKEHITFYIYSLHENDDVWRITQILSKLLQRKGLKHEIEWNKMLLYKLKKKK